MATTKKDLPVLDLKERFLEVLATDEVAGNISHAVHAMRQEFGDGGGVSRAWVYLRRKEDKDFDRRVKKIQRDSWELLADEAETNLRKSAIQGNTTANIFILKNLRPDKWRDRQEHTGEAGKPIEVRAPKLETWLTANLARMAKHAQTNQGS